MRNFFLFCFVAALLLAGCTKKQEHHLMNYRTLGNTGIEVAELGLGCEAFKSMDTAQSREYMALALDSGMNYIDIYDSDPTVRSNIGYALRGRRDEMNIQGHIGVFHKNGQYCRTRNVEEAKMGFEDLLSRLETDHIEVGMIHITDNLADWDSLQNSDFFQYVLDLKKEGKIKHIGMSSHNAEVALKAAQSGYIEVIMFSLNPAFDRLTSDMNIWDNDSYKHALSGIDPVRIQFYDYCVSHQIGLVVMKTFGGGRLLDAEKSPFGFAMTPIQCITYALDKPAVSCALTGAHTIDELMASLAWLTASNEEKDYSSALATYEKSREQSLGCTFCGHCAPCKMGIDIAEVNRLLEEANKYECVGLPEELQQQYDALPHKASECIMCGGCETRCPFHISIREQMKMAAKIFENKEL